MSCPEVNFCIVQGDTKKYRLTFWSDKSHTTRIDITDAAITMVIRKSPTETIEKTAAHTDNDQGEAEIILDAADTSLPLGKYRYHIRVESPSLGKKTIRRGVIEVVWQEKGEDEDE